MWRDRVISERGSDDLAFENSRFLLIIDLFELGVYDVADARRWFEMFALSPVFFLPGFVCTPLQKGLVFWNVQACDTHRGKTRSSESSSL